MCSKILKHFSGNKKSKTGYAYKVLDFFNGSWQFPCAHPHGHKVEFGKWMKADSHGFHVFRTKKGAQDWWAYTPIHEHNPSTIFRVKVRNRIGVAREHSGTVFVAKEMFIPFQKGIK